jgi:hypothetical protein
MQHIVLSPDHAAVASMNEARSTEHHLCGDDQELRQPVPRCVGTEVTRKRDGRLVHTR